MADVAFVAIWTGSRLGDVSRDRRPRPWSRPPGDADGADGRRCADVAEVMGTGASRPPGEADVPEGRRCKVVPDIPPVPPGMMASSTLELVGASGGLRVGVAEVWEDGVEAEGRVESGGALA